MKKEQEDKHTLKPIEEYYSLIDVSVNKIFSDARRKATTQLQFDIKQDLYQAGAIALIEAYNNFDITKNTAFSTYAYSRIRGAVFDFLRSEDVGSRTLRTRLKQIKQNENGQYTSDTLSEKLVEKTMKNNRSVVQFSKPENMEKISSDEIFSNGQLPPIPQEAVIIKETVKTIINKSKLNDEEREIINLYYFKHHTYAAIGKQLNITESRISQLHKSILNRLRAYATKQQRSNKSNTTTRA